MPWLIERREIIFYIFLAVFSLFLLINQGGASDLRRAPIWALIGFAYLAFLLFYFLEYARPRGIGLPMPGSRQLAFKIFFRVFILFLLFNILFAVSTWEAVHESLIFLAILLVMSLVSFYAQTPRKISNVILIFMSLGLFASLFGLFMYIKTRAIVPLDSFFAWHNPAGGYFAAICIVFLAWIFTNSPRKPYGWFGWIGAIFSAAALIFTLSRGAWLSIIPALLLLLILLAAKRGFNKVGILSFVLVLVIAAVLLVSIGGRSFLGPVYQRLASFSATTDFSVEGRRNFYSGAVAIFKDYPLTGIGLGCFGFVYPRYQKDPRFYAKDPHSFYLRLASEGGVFGLIIVAMIFALYFILVIAYFRNRDKSKVPLGAGLVAALTVGLLHCAIDFDDTFPVILLNLGVIWVCAMNLLEPVIPKPPQPDAEMKKPLIRGTLKGSSIALAILFFIAIIYSGRMYFSETNYDMGKIFADSNQWDKAETSFATALDYFPSNDRALLERSRALLLLHDNMVTSGREEPSESNLLLQKAVTSTQKLKKIAPFRATSYFLSGMALIRLTDKEKQIESVKDFQSALELDPMNSPEFYLNTARAELDVKTIEDFRDTLRKFEKTFPFNKVEEYTRTRLEWDKLPVIYQDMLLLDEKVLKFDHKYSAALKVIPKIRELEKVREKISGESYEARKDVLNYLDMETSDLKDLESGKNLKPVIDEITKF